MLRVNQMVVPGSLLDIAAVPFLSYWGGRAVGRSGAEAVGLPWLVAGGRWPSVGGQRRGSRSLPIRSRSMRSSVRTSRVTRPMIRWTSSSSWKSVRSRGSNAPSGTAVYSGGGSVGGSYGGGGVWPWCGRAAGETRLLSVSPTVTAAAAARAPVVLWPKGVCWVLACDLDLDLPLFQKRWTTGWEAAESAVAGGGVREATGRGA